MDRIADGYRAMASACVVQAQALEVQQRALMRMHVALVAMADLQDPPREFPPPSRPAEPAAEDATDPPPP